jgi:hypothetical protein
MVHLEITAGSLPQNISDGKPVKKMARATLTIGFMKR